MLLREYLQHYTKEELLEHVRNFELKKCSKLRKAALIDRILEYFCSEEVIRSRLACLTKKQMALFRRTCDMPQDVSMNELGDSIQLCRY